VTDLYMKVYVKFQKIRKETIAVEIKKCFFNICVKRTLQNRESRKA